MTIPGNRAVTRAEPGCNLALSTELGRAGPMCEWYMANFLLSFSYTLDRVQAYLEIIAISITMACMKQNQSIKQKSSKNSMIQPLPCFTYGTGSCIGMQCFYFYKEITLK